MAHVSTGCHDDALDLVQEAMIKFVSNYQHKPAEQWKPLFYRVLNSKMMDLHRRRKVRNGITRLFGFDGEEDTFDSGLQTPDDQLKTRGAMTELDQALGELPARQQQAVMLRLIDGLNTNDTALAMGVSAGSVKTHYSRAISALRERLGEHWP